MMSVTLSPGLTPKQIRLLDGFARRCASYEGVMHTVLRRLGDKESWSDDEVRRAIDHVERAMKG